MKSKNLFKLGEAAEASFANGLEGIKAFNDTLPIVSKTDQQGNKLYKSVIPLLPTAISIAPRLTENLRGGFDLNNIINNNAARENLIKKIADLEVEKHRMEAALACFVVNVDNDYREIYMAIKEAALDDASLTDTRDKLGEPYKKTNNASTDETTPDTPTAEKKGKTRKKGK
jgi:hypothetical protein